MNWQTDAASIETLVLARKTAALRQQIPRFLRKHRSATPDVVFVACDWYRRLGLHEKGYRLMAPEEPLPKITSTETFEGRRVLWAARFLNLMGASDFAVSLLDQIEPRSFDDYRILGSIFLAQLDFHRARAHLETARELDPEPSRYISRLSLLNLADACCGLGKHTTAIKLSRQVFEQSSEPLLKGIALVAQGEYLAGEERFAEALVVLKQAAEYFPAGDRTPDMGLRYKWLGYVLAKVGQERESAKAFDSALEILRSSALRFEAWLDVLRLRSRVGLLDAKRTAMLGIYPTVSERFKATLTAAVQTPQAVVSSVAWRIDPESDEYWHRETPTLGLPAEIHLLFLLKLAGQWGVPLVRLKSALWPSEVYSYLFMEDRLHHLIQRLRRHHGFSIRLENRILYLEASSIDAVQVLAGKNDSRPSFVRTRGLKSFRRSDVQSYYGITSTPAWQRIQQWLAQGWIKLSKSEKRTAHYEVV